jgi:signal transduction histidine kinase/ActR/RegA family two-component response regulator
MRLRTHLISLVFAALIPIIVFSAISLVNLRDAHRAAALNSIRETARATTLIIDREFSGVRAALKVLATSDALREGNFKQFYEQAKIANLAGDGWIILYGEDGQQIISTRVPFGTPLPKRSVNLDDFAKIKSGGTVHVSNLTWGVHIQRHVILVDSLVTIGSKRYVLTQAVPQDYFNRAFAGRGIKSSWVVAIFDQVGNTLARSHGAHEFVGKKANADTVRAIQTGYEGVMRHKIRGNIEVYDVFTHSALADWTVAIGAPVEEIDSAVRQAIWVTGLGLLTAILLASGVAWIVGRKILHAVDGAVLAASGLGKGQAIQIPRSGVAEMNELNATLVEASQTLEREKASRHAAEAERNRLLLSEQAARRFAEDQNKAKDQFLAMLGHELRNPLAAIISAIDILDVADNTAMSERARKIISRQGDHLTHIVDDLLDVSRVLSGKVMLNKQPLDLAGMVSQCVGTLQSTGRARHHSMELAATEPLWIEADATRIEQIVNNLLDNAIKYTPDGGDIKVSTQASGHEAVLTVTDTGIGISAELLPNIFDVFVQGERSLERAKGGLGIGLALVRQLTELHGGSITCTSNGAGRGSLFTLRFPLAQVNRTTLADKAVAGVQQTCTVVLIDDHDDAREMTTGMLEKHGFHVIALSDGEAGISACLSGTADVALIDIGMPTLSGYDIARRVRSVQQKGRTKLIALTGYGSKEDHQRSFDAGFDAHLTKPLTLAKFSEALKALNKSSD